MTDLSQSPDSLPVRKPGEPLPQSGEPLPQRADPLPQRGELLPQRGEPLPPRSELLPQRGEPLAQDDTRPQRGAPEPLPQRGELLPQRDEPLPQRGAPGPLFQRGAPEPLPQRGEPLPQRGAPEPLPQRGEPLPQRGAPEPLPQRGEPLPQRGAPEPLPQRGEPLPQRGAPEPLPQRGELLPQRGEPLPQRGEPLPQRGAPEPLPQRGELLPQRGEPLPQRGEPLPQRGEPLPQRGEPLPQRGAPLPQRGDENGVQPGALPRRTSRTRPAGRHRSPHRLSVASGAPALVIAVPGTAEADSANVAAEVATIAELSCPGVDIRVGYLDGAAFTLSDCLHSGTGGSEAGQPDSVIVPLLLSPNDRADTALARIAELTEENVTLAAHLAPHPLVAEALHARLAEAGFVRQARAAGLSISSGGRGVVVLADIGEEAAAAASVAAVLLASRLSVPVMPASLGNPASIADAVVRLSESGAASPVLAPCLIGPEISQTVLDDLSAALGAPCAAPLGAHQAVGQLVAIRYGAALARLSLAG